MTISYRDDHDLDYAELARLFESVGWGERVDDPVRFEALVRASPWVVTAWEADRLVGFSRAITDRHTTAYVTDVVVHELYRREGVGSELVRRLMAGRDEIHFVLRAEPKNHPLYLRLGFEAAPTMLRRRRKRKA